MSSAFIEWREAEQARNLADAFHDDERILVWCGLGHHQKGPSMMGGRFIEFTGLTHFAIDQVGAVLVGLGEQAVEHPEAPFSPAGFLCTDPPPGLHPSLGVDACIVGDCTLE